jgi:ATP-dependent RNA helicase DHX37/DHR1
MARKIQYGKGDRSDDEDLNNQLSSQVNDTKKDGTNTMTSLENEKSKRKRKLKETLIEQHKEKITRKKKKRLDKYIEHQLKREEKEILLKKLEETRIDTSILRSAKLIGTGDRKTKKEKIIEALELERLGKSTDESKALLYEEREVKTWSDLLDSNETTQSGKKENKYIDTTGHSSGDESNDDGNEEFKSTATGGSGFIDYRPAQPFSGMGTGFGFGNVEKAKSKKKKKNYSWRTKIELEEKKSKADED